MSEEREINCYSGDLGIEKGMSYKELRDVILNPLLKHEKHISNFWNIEKTVIHSAESVCYSDVLNAAI